ncbi:unnamed protein product [Dibothriocephalus latus]|uniref:Vta1 C-terminal domain-containing protein n=1 Tax=Dibothriocephalus latus TaxID=60516 RepID=A0A3P6PRI1_DIBLA|nr:unnamed protein product [Dibothriocephalus latus]
MAKLTPDAQPTNQTSSGGSGMADYSEAAETAAQGGSRNELDPKISKAAIKHAKFAISALDYDDRATAIKNLQEALKLLTT